MPGRGRRRGAAADGTAALRGRPRRLPRGPRHGPRGPLDVRGPGPRELALRGQRARTTRDRPGAAQQAELQPLAHPRARGLRGGDRPQRRRRRRDHRPPHRRRRDLPPALRSRRAPGTRRAARGPAGPPLPRVLDAEGGLHQGPRRGARPATRLVRDRARRRWAHRDQLRRPCRRRPLGLAVRPAMGVGHREPCRRHPPPRRRPRRHPPRRATAARKWPARARDVPRARPTARRAARRRKPAPRGSSRRS